MEVLDQRELEHKYRMEELAVEAIEFHEKEVENMKKLETAEWTAKQNMKKLEAAERRVAEHIRGLVEYKKEIMERQEMEEMTAATFAWAEIKNKVITQRR